MQRACPTVFLLLGLILLILTGCSAQDQGPAAPPLTDDVAVDLLWKYEQALQYKLSDPAQYVADLEKQWLGQFLSDRAAGKKRNVMWAVTGALLKVEKSTAKEAVAVTQFDRDNKTYTIRFKFLPVNGEWKIANHQNMDGTWWKPGSE